MSEVVSYRRDVPHPTPITSAVLSLQDIPYSPLTTVVKKQTVRIQLLGYFHSHSMSHFFLSSYLHTPLAELR